MKRHWLQKIVAAVTGAVLLAGSMGAGALAAPATVGDVTEVTDEASIVIHVADNVEGQIGVGTEDSTLNGKALADVQLKYLQIGELVQVDSGQKIEMMYQIPKNSKLVGTETSKPIVIAESDITYQDDSSYYIVPDTLQNALTTSIGSNIVGFIAKVHDVTDVSWSTVETEEPQGGGNAAATINAANGLYFFMGGTMPANVSTLLTPFLVSAPMPDTDGSGWLDTIHVYPKVRLSEITIVKTAQQDGRTATSDAATGGKDAILAEAGRSITYTVKVTIPGYSDAGTAAEFSRFVISDTAPTGMNISNISIGMTSGSKPVTLEAGTDYTLDATGFPITFTDDGMEKLTDTPNENKEITVTYTGQLGAGASLGTAGNTNTAQVEYQRSGMNASQTISAAVSVHTYGIDVTKTLSDNGTITAGEIKFTLAKKAAQTGDTDIPVYVTGADGTYWVDADATQDTTGATTELTAGTGTDANLMIHGLIPGTYILTETETMSGYSRLDEPVTIVITAPTGDDPKTSDITAAADGETATVEKGAVKLGVVNTAVTTGFTLPKTGGAGMLAAVVAGMGLICSAVVFFAVYRKRNERR